MEMITENHKIMYRLLILVGNVRNYSTVSKLFVLDKNIRHYVTVWKKIFKNNDAKCDYERTLKVIP